MSNGRNPFVVAAVVTHRLYACVAYNLLVTCLMARGVAFVISAVQLTCELDAVCFLSYM